MAYDKRVFEAIDIIYVRKDYSQGRHAMNILTEAANEGNGDACFVLARCYAGASFADSLFEFPTNDTLVKQYLDKSLSLGSAIGMFGARRFSGYQPIGKTFVHAPYQTDRQIWDAVSELAMEGDLFSEMLIANAYYWGDAPEFLGIDLENMDIGNRNKLLKKMAQTAIAMYEDLMYKGLFLVRMNYKDLITSGDYGIEPDAKRLKWLKKIVKEDGRYTV